MNIKLNSKFSKWTLVLAIFAIIIFTYHQIWETLFEGHEGDFIVILIGASIFAITLYFFAPRKNLGDPVKVKFDTSNFGSVATPDISDFERKTLELTVEVKELINKGLKQLSSLKTKQGAISYELAKNLVDTSEALCNRISLHFQYLTDKGITVHIKNFVVDDHLDFKSFNNCRIYSHDPLVRTLVISKQNKENQRRLRAFKHPISKNTPFLNIMSGREPFIYIPNLPEYIRQHAKLNNQEYRYKTTAENFLKNYSSQYVFPIRRKVGNKWEYTAFILFDSLKNHMFNTEQSEVITRFCEAIQSDLFAFVKENIEAQFKLSMNSSNSTVKKEESKNVKTKKYSSYIYFLPDKNMLRKDDSQEKSYSSGKMEYSPEKKLKEQQLILN
ncbi:hypothetical protein [Owenweeksia hongkongensis]|uniref:hypothetical protein n=1 Tax=Owenweeksia hongkongensis TaxID=253245 RepID=UPI003A8F157B